MVLSLHDFILFNNVLGSQLLGIYKKLPTCLRSLACYYRSIISSAIMLVLDHLFEPPL